MWIYYILTHGKYLQFYKFVFFLNLIELNLAVDRSFFISNNALFTPLLYCLSN